VIEDLAEDWPATKLWKKTAEQPDGEIPGIQEFDIFTQPFSVDLK